MSNQGRAELDHALATVEAREAEEAARADEGGGGVAEPARGTASAVGMFAGSGGNEAIIRRIWTVVENKDPDGCTLDYLIENELTGVALGGKYTLLHACMAKMVVGMNQLMHGDCEVHADAKLKIKYYHQVIKKIVGANFGLISVVDSMNKLPIEEASVLLMDADGEVDAGCRALVLKSVRLCNTGGKRSLAALDVIEQHLGEKERVRASLSEDQRRSFLVESFKRSRSNLSKQFSRLGAL